MTNADLRRFRFKEKNDRHSRQNKRSTRICVCIKLTESSGLPSNKSSHINSNGQAKQVADTGYEMQKRAKNIVIIKKIKTDALLAN